MPDVLVFLILLFATLLVSWILFSIGFLIFSFGRKLIMEGKSSLSYWERMYRK